MSFTDWLNNLLERIGQMDSGRTQFMVDYWYLYVIFLMLAAGFYQLTRR
ncbi:hypothetical protein SPX_43360 [Sporomusa paucivorans]